jgi:hypothetical protein
MHIDELIEQQKHKDSQDAQPRKRYALKFSLLTSAGLIITLSIIVILLLHKPASYEPPRLIEDNQVSKYLTHVISQDLYNGAQAGEPFELVITEEGIGDIVARSDWPRQVGEASFAVPEVKFEADNILLRGMVSLDTVELFVVIAGTARVDEQALLHLNVTRIKIGAVNVTALARVIASTIYNSEATRRRLDEDDWRAKIMTSLLLNEPFEPVFEIEGAKVRIDDVRIEPGKVTIHFVPANYY